MLKVDICANTLIILATYSHNYGVQILSQELEIDNDWYHELHYKNTHAKNPTLPSELTLEGLRVVLIGSRCFHHKVTCIVTDDES